MSGTEGGDALALAVVGSLPDAVIVMDAGGDLVWGNPAAEQLFGITLEQGLGRNGIDFIHPDDLTARGASRSRACRRRRSGTPLELRVRGADGWRLVEMIGAPFGDDLVLSVRDLTERRRWEVAGDEIERVRSLMQNAASVTMLVTRDGVRRVVVGRR